MSALLYLAVLNLFSSKLWPGLQHHLICWFSVLHVNYHILVFFVPADSHYPQTYDKSSRNATFPTRVPLTSRQEAYDNGKWIVSASI